MKLRKLPTLFCLTVREAALYKILVVSMVTAVVDIPPIKEVLFFKGLWKASRN